MAPLWIKVTHWTPDKPEVFCVAELLKIDPDAVVGKLIRVWIWADQQLESCNAVSVTKVLLDRIACVTGFSDALVKVGWLVENEGVLSFTNFDRHNGKTAKKRANTAIRVEKHRVCNAGSVTNVTQVKRSERYKSVTPALPDRDEDRDEDIKETPLPPLQGEAADAASESLEISKSALAFVRDSWNASGAITNRKFTPKLIRSCRARLRDPWWSEHWLAALEKIPRCPFLLGENDTGWKADLEWFLRPDSVQRIIEGKYDAPPPTRNGVNAHGVVQKSSYTPAPAMTDEEAGVPY
jgi:hypothetical protein